MDEFEKHQWMVGKGNVLCKLKVEEKWGER